MFAGGVVVAVVVVPVVGGVLTAVRITVTGRQAENSDVAPVALFVAVAVMTSVAPKFRAVVVKLAPPPPLVVAVVDPSGVLPSPNPDGSQLGLEKNRTVKLWLGAEVSVPVTVGGPLPTVAEASTGAPAAVMPSGLVVEAEARRCRRSRSRPRWRCCRR